MFSDDITVNILLLAYSLHNMYLQSHGDLSK
jgi:hypothetical protein